MHHADCWPNFRGKTGQKGGLDSLLRKLQETGSTGSKARQWTTEARAHGRQCDGSGGPCTQWRGQATESSIDTADIQRDRSVVRIIHCDLRLKCFKKRRAQELIEANRHARFRRSKLLLKKYSSTDVAFICFTDEKIFTVATPKNPQNDWVYAPATSQKKDVAAKRLLRTRSTFSESLMVSVGVSTLAYTNLIWTRLYTGLALYVYSQMRYNQI